LLLSSTDVVTVVEIFIDEAQRRRWGNGYTSGYINIEEHLKAAERKIDADFAGLSTFMASRRLLSLLLP
jgi:hypothetical protein